MIGAGGFLLIGRASMTGADKFINLSKPEEKIVIHQRRGGTGFILKGKLVELEHIVVKYGKSWMIFKDTGGNRRIAKHDVVFTNETVNHTIPEPIADYIYKIKRDFGVGGLKELNDLHNQLKNITNHEELYQLQQLRDILKDPEKRKVLMRMPIEEIRRLGELLYDGTIMHMENYEDFQESAAPYDLESYTTKKIAHRIYQNKMYMPLGTGDWMKYVLAFGVLIILGAIAYQIFGG